MHGMEGKTTAKRRHQGLWTDLAPNKYDFKALFTRPTFPLPATAV